MESQFNLGSADNKGILSLLSAIEQTGDNFDTDPESPEPIKDEMGGQDPAFNHLEGLEIHSDIGFSMSKAVCLCLICGQSSLTDPNDPMTMVDIFMEMSGRKLSQRIEDIVSRKILPHRHSTLICNECFGLLQQIELLESELMQYKRTVTSKFSSSNPVKNKKTSPKKVSYSSNHVTSIPSVCEPLDYSEPIIDPKMPLQFLANEKEIERDLEQLQEKNFTKKSKLEMLADTMQEFDDYSYNSSEDENTFQDSLNSKKEKPTLECEVCNKIFKNNTLYKRHIKTHTKEKLYKCEECSKDFISKSNLQAHQKIHFETKTYGCPHCSREFKGKKSLLEHVSSKHNNEKRFVCSQCPESFVSRHLKNVHERTHNGEKGFICDQCGDSFATSQGLSHHKSKHTGDYQFRCRACDKGFNNYKLLEEHFHIHTGNKPYQCSKCEKGFANRGSLWIHMKQHDNMKPYACTDCSKSFTHSSHLAVHKRIHTGEKPYKCRICGEGFISSNHLKRHMKSHANQLPFACGTCKQTFTQRRQLVTHSNKVHGGNVVEDTVPANATKEEESEENLENSSTFLINKVNGDNLAEGEGYSLMPVVSIIEGSGMGGMLGDQMELEGGMEQQRLVDLLGQDGVSLGQTIVLIQVPHDQNEGGGGKSMVVAGHS